MRFATRIGSIICLLLASTLHAEETEFTIRVTAEGKPAAGAKVWLRADAYTHEMPIGPEVANGEGVVKWKIDPEKNKLAFATDATGRFGLIRFDRSEQAPTDLILELRPVTVAEGIVKAEGKPLSGVKCILDYVQIADKLDSQGREFSFNYPLGLPNAETLTDAEGRYKFVNVAKDYAASIVFQKAGYGVRDNFQQPDEKDTVELRAAWKSNWRVPMPRS
jgi:hypothetical protein